MTWQKLAVSILFSVVVLRVVCLDEMPYAQTACAEDDILSVMQVSTGLHQVRNNSVRVAVREGHSNNSTRKATMLQEKATQKSSTSSMPSQKALQKTLQDTVPLLKSWFSPKLGKISVVSISCLVFAIAIIFFCAVWVLSENAPSVFSQAPYKIGSGSYDWKECLLASSFAFVGGWSDAICLIRYKAFATMMTGNFFLMGYTMVYQKGAVGPPFYIVTIVAYIAGIIIFRSSQLRWGDRTATFFGPMLALGMVAFELFDALNSSPLFGHDMWVVPVLAPVFGILNVVSAKGGLCMSTAFLSGHLQDLTYAFVQRLCTGNIPSQNQSKLVVQAVIIISLVSGAVAAAMFDRCFHDLNASTHLEVSLVPVAPLLAFSFVMHDRMYYKSSYSDAISTPNEQ